MTTPLARSVHRQRQAIRRWLPQRRDDSGLTTLEWLLIVAAVAGLAALAVVLVQNVIGQTSEQIAGSSARKTAAEVAALSVVEESKTLDAADTATADDKFGTWAKWDTYFTAKCNRIGITYSDADIKVASAFAAAKTGTISVAAAATATKAAAVGAVPQADCAVT